MANRESGNSDASMWGGEVRHRRFDTTEAAQRRRPTQGDEGSYLPVGVEKNSVAPAPIKIAREATRITIEIDNKLDTHDDDSSASTLT